LALDFRTSFRTVEKWVFSRMSLRIENGSVFLEVGDTIIATAVYRSHAAADGQGAWIVSNKSRTLV
jgi:hypothetical protein